MAHLEERILEDIELQPRIWWKYIDDNFFYQGKWRFTETLDTFHHIIKFTAGWSRKKINFLDVHVIPINRELETDLHIKPTDTNQFRDSTSCNPYHFKKNTLYSQAFRYSRICSDNENLDQHCNNLEK